MTNIDTGNWHPYPDSTVFDVRSFGPNKALWETQQRLLREELRTRHGIGIVSIDETVQVVPADPEADNLITINQEKEE